METGGGSKGVHLIDEKHLNHSVLPKVEVFYGEPPTHTRVPQLLSFMVGEVGVNHLQGNEEPLTDLVERHSPYFFFLWACFLLYSEIICGRLVEYFWNKHLKKITFCS